MLGRSFVIFRRTLFIRCITIFLFVIPLYQFILESVVLQESALDLDRLFYFLGENILFSSSCLMAAIFCWRLRQASFFLSVIVVLYGLLSSMIHLMNDLSELTFFMVFVFALVSFYFLLNLAHELARPCYSPGFSGHDIMQGSVGPPLPVQIRDSEGGQEISGNLTNWGPDSCFILFDKKLQEIPREVFLTFDFGNKVFHSSGLVLTFHRNLAGLGISLVWRENSAQLFSWHQLYSILYERSFIPERLS